MLKIQAITQDWCGKTAIDLSHSKSKSSMCQTETQGTMSLRGREKSYLTQHLQDWHGNFQEEVMFGVKYVWYVLCVIHVEHVL